MGITRGGCCKSATSGVFGGKFVETAKAHSGIEGFQGIEGKLVENFRPDACPEFVKGMGGDGDPPAFLDSGDYFDGGTPFHLRKGGAEAEEMPVGCGDFHAGNDKKSVNCLSILPDESLACQMLHGITGVMVGDGDAAESPAFGGGDHRLRGGAAIRGVKGVQVQVEAMEHERCIVAAEAPRCQAPKNACWFLLCEVALGG